MQVAKRVSFFTTANYVIIGAIQYLMTLIGDRWVTLCNGDSGGGICFPSAVHEKYYIHVSKPYEYFMMLDFALFELCTYILILIVFY